VRASIEWSFGGELRAREDGAAFRDRWRRRRPEPPAPTAQDFGSWRAHPSQPSVIINAAERSLFKSGTTPPQLLSEAPTAPHSFLLPLSLSSSPLPLSSTREPIALLLPHSPSQSPIDFDEEETDPYRGTWILISTCRGRVSPFSKSLFFFCYLISL